MKKSILVLSLGLGLSYNTCAQHTVDCSFTSVSGTINTSRTLHANILYRLEGCVDVSSGVTLTIEPGTHILAEKGSNAALYIEPGAIIDAQGTASLPIVFNSDQAPSFRDYGDWQGVIIGGNAINNVPTTGLVTLSRNCSISAGGMDDADYSGILQYVQIHHAKYGLELVSVGNTTIVDHIDVSQSSKNAFSIYGGAVNLKFLASKNAKLNDYFISYGYQGKMQFALASREDASAFDASGSYGLFIENNPSTASATRYTTPVISNMTLLGPAFCNAGMLSGNFKDAVHLENYVRMGIFNSVFEGFVGDGLTINGSTAVGNTASNLVSFSYNSFAGLGGTDVSSSGWTGGCGPFMDTWFDGTSGSGCRESGNQPVGFGVTGYDNTIICSSSTPDFRLNNTTALDAVDYSHADLNDGFFNKTFAYRGAFDETTNWTDEWTDFDAQNTAYCSHRKMAGQNTTEAVRNDARLSIYPNPAVSKVTASFDADKAGSATVFIIDKVSGKVLRKVKSTVTQTGKQKVSVDVSGLMQGSYILKAETSDGKVLRDQIMVTD